MHPPDAEIFVLTLRAEAVGEAGGRGGRPGFQPTVPAIIRLRAALKRLLRDHGLRWQPSHRWLGDSH